MPATTAAKMTSKKRREALGKVLRDSREAMGLSQKEVAETLGITQPMVSMLESGRNVVPLDAVLDVSEAYAISTNLLLTRFKDKSKK